MAGEHEILVVEDDDFWRKALSEALANAGYRVRVAGDGGAAIEELLEAPPDVVVMDYYLPKVDGGRLCEFVKNQEELRTIPTVVISGGLIGLDREALPDADAAIAKGPLEKVLPQLVEVVADLLAGQKIEEYRRAIVEPAVLPTRDQTRKLRKLKEYLDTLLDQLVEIVCEVDGRRRIISVNNKCEALVGRPEHDLLGQDILEVLDLEPGCQLDEALQASLGTVDMETTSVAEFTFAERHLEATVSRLPFAPDDLGAIIVGRDATSRLQMERSLRETEEQLRQVQKMEAIGRLAGAVAHDFNNVLTSVAGYAELVLTSETLSEQERSDIEQISEAAKRATKLTRQLLAFAKRQVMQPEVIDLNSVISGMEKMLNRLVGERIELRTLLTDGLGRVEADPGQIEQIVMNLAVNARDAMPEGGQLLVMTSNLQLDQAVARYSWYVEPGPYISLVVSDTGHGMDEETITQVFEPFFTTKTKDRGTGLGLSTVYGIVKQCGGDISVDSTPGEGTTFTIYLPRSDRPLGEQKVESRRRTTISGHETILVAEDDSQVLELISRSLMAHGYRVLSGTNGEEALAVARQQSGPIHLLVTDVVMPKMGGRELARQVSSLSPETRVLFISGYAADESSRDDSAPLPQPLLPKPFLPEDLLRRIREMLDAGRS